MTLEEIIRTRKAWSEGDNKRDAGLTEPSEIESFRNIPYLADRLTEHLLDVYRPKTRKNCPVLLSIHGGGWFYGDKERYRFYCMYMAKLGFVVINCNYRLVPEYLYPAALEDVCAVVRWLRENMERLTENAHWFMTGDSAGAQLVTQYCILAANTSYRERLGIAGSEQLPDAVALNCGIYDMKNLHESFKDCYIQTANPEQLALFDHMLDNMTADFPPTYLMTSVNDGMNIHTLPMKQRLKELGVPFVYRQFGEGVPEDSHVFHLNLYSENGRKCNGEEAAFFQKYAR